jgi:hypothetical protein
LEKRCHPLAIKGMATRGLQGAALLLCAKPMEA